MSDMARFDPELGYVPLIPEPFWIRTWRTLFRWRPGCYVCRVTFKDRSEWERHYVFNHLESGEKDGDGV